MDLASEIRVRVKMDKPQRLPRGTLSDEGSGCQRAKTFVRRRPQTNCCGSARTLGEMEECSA
jgi:hypothetical protein